MTYEEAKKQAQMNADADGHDRGVEKLDGDYRTYMLPCKRNRFGHELRCEVVSCSVWARIAPGHGP